MSQSTPPHNKKTHIYTLENAAEAAWTSVETVAEWMQDNTLIHNVDYLMVSRPGVKGPHWAFNIDALLKPADILFMADELFKRGYTDVQEKDLARVYKEAGLTLLPSTDYAQENRDEDDSPTPEKPSLSPLAPTSLKGTRGTDPDLAYGFKHAEEVTGISKGIIQRWLVHQKLKPGVDVIFAGSNPYNVELFRIEKLLELRAEKDQKKATVGISHPVEKSLYEQKIKGWQESGPYIYGESKAATFCGMSDVTFHRVILDRFVRGVDYLHQSDPRNPTAATIFSEAILQHLKDTWQDRRLGPKPKPSPKRDAAKRALMLKKRLRALGYSYKEIRGLFEKHDTPETPDALPKLIAHWERP